MGHEISSFCWCTCSGFGVGWIGCSDAHWMKRVEEAGLWSPGKQGRFWDLALLAVCCRAPGHRWGGWAEGRWKRWLLEAAVYCCNPAAGEKPRKNLSNKESFSLQVSFNFNTLRRNNPSSSRSTHWQRVGTESHRSQGNWLFSSKIVFTAWFQCEEVCCCVTGLECEDKLYVLYKRSKKILWRNRFDAPATKISCYAMKSALWLPHVSQWGCRRKHLWKVRARVRLAQGKQNMHDWHLRGR